MEDIDVFGTSNGLDSLILEVSQERDEITNIFNSIEDSVSHLKESYSCPATDAMVSKFQKAIDNFPQITRNLDVYSDDLIRAKDNTAQVVMKTQTVANNAITHLESVTNKNINAEVK